MSSSSSLTDITCSSDVDAPTNGKVNVTNFTPDGTAVYTCDEGYALVGKGIRICAKNGSWGGEVPKCLGKFNYFVALYIIFKQLIFIL